VFQTVFVFMNTEVSSFYLDVAKDRLYIRGEVRGSALRGAQAASWREKS
jgi:isoleucyl-tRNA synthetase